MIKIDGVCQSDTLYKKFNDANISKLGAIERSIVKSISNLPADIASKLSENILNNICNNVEGNEGIEININLNKEVLDSEISNCNILDDLYIKLRQMAKNKQISDRFFLKRLAHIDNLARLLARAGFITECNKIIHFLNKDFRWFLTWNNKPSYIMDCYTL